MAGIASSELGKLASKDLSKGHQYLYLSLLVVCNAHNNKHQALHFAGVCRCLQVFAGVHVRQCCVPAALWVIWDLELLKCQEEAAVKYVLHLLCICAKLTVLCSRKMSLLSGHGSGSGDPVGNTAA